MCQRLVCTENIQTSQFPSIDAFNVEWKLDRLAPSANISALELPIFRGQDARILSTKPGADPATTYAKFGSGLLPNRMQQSTVNYRAHR